MAKLNRIRVVLAERDLNNDTLLSCLHGGGPEGKARQELQEDGRGSE